MVMIINDCCVARALSVICINVVTFHLEKVAQSNGANIFLHLRSQMSPPNQNKRSSSGRLLPLGLARESCLFDVLIETET